MPRIRPAVLSVSGTPLWPGLPSPAAVPSAACFHSVLNSISHFLRQREEGEEYHYKIYALEFKLPHFYFCHEFQYDEKLLENLG